MRLSLTLQGSLYPLASRTKDLGRLAIKKAPRFNKPRGLTMVLHHYSLRCTTLQASVRTYAAFVHSPSRSKLSTGHRTRIHCSRHAARPLSYQAPYPTIGTHNACALLRRRLKYAQMSNPKPGSPRIPRKTCPEQAHQAKPADNRHPLCTDGHLTGHPTATGDTQTCLRAYHHTDSIGIKNKKSRGNFVV